MRTLISIAFLIPSLAFLPVAASAADSPKSNLILHVAEGAAPGHVVGDLPTLLKFGEQTTCRLLSQGNVEFEINPTGQLIVAADAQLDYERHLTHALTLELKTRAVPDPLQEKFVEILGHSSSAGRVAGWDRRIIRIEVVVDDRPEPPQILPQIFPSVQSGAHVPGLVLGRVIAADPDWDDQLRFQLVDSASWLSIDPVSGQLSIQDSVSIPDISQIRTTVEVVDSTGLAASREIVIPIRFTPQKPHKGLIDPHTVTSGTQDGSHDASEAPMAGPAESASPLESGPTQTATAVAEVPGGAISMRSANADKDRPEGKPRNAVSQPPAAAAVAAAPGRVHSARASVPRSAVWVLICVVCVLVFAALCWRPLQAQLQGLVLQPETADPANEDNRPANQQVSRPLSASSAPVDANAVEAPGCRHGNADTRELHALLESLDESCRPRTATETARGSSAEDDERFAIFEDGPSQTTSAAAIAKAVKVARESAVIPATDDSSHPVRTRAVPQGKSERDQMEEFRQIARTFNRADIDRSRRAQMRGEWMSRGAAVASSAITGSICLFTNCFGAISVPCGTVLLAVAAALLMKRSLYYDSFKPSPSAAMPSEVTSDRPPGATTEL